MNKLNRRVYLRVTNRCNKTCSFCFYKNDPKNIDDMDLDILKKLILKELAFHDNSSPLYVELTGGEPTLYKNLKEALRYLSTITNVTITMETNGSTLDSPQLVDLLDIFKNSNNFLKISLNSELIESDSTWLPKVTKFIHFAKEVGINYRLNIRAKDRSDQLELQQIIEENNLQHIDFKKLQYYRLRDENLYRDGKLSITSGPVIIYDFDGRVLVTTSLESDAEEI